jgi:hypothetical protein
MYPTEDVNRALGAMDFLRRGWSWLQSPIAQLAGRIGDRPLVPSPYVALRGAADNRGSGGTSRTDARVAFAFSHDHGNCSSSAPSHSRQRSDTFVELTLIVDSSPAYTRMRLQAVSPQVSDYLCDRPRQSAMRLRIH